MFQWRPGNEIVIILEACNGFQMFQIQSNYEIIIQNLIFHIS